MKNPLLCRGHTDFKRIVSRHEENGGFIRFFGLKYFYIPLSDIESADTYHGSPAVEKYAEDFNRNQGIHKDT